MKFEELEQTIVEKDKHIGTLDNKIVEMNKKV